ncbi:MAG: 23S rRNA (guanosine(2251)-2'-O)-methyltransferase RlmB, partial [Muribaculaceae bacterium]|nr:23S rRNA (guanosine(2251)-2'-O)-methyltransferase RlmB [Muribaculaceae bacterium]
MDQSNYIFGIRAVMEAVEAGREIDKVLIRKDLSGPLASELLGVLRARKVVTQRVPEERINRITRKNPQGGA